MSKRDWLKLRHSCDMKYSPMPRGMTMCTTAPRGNNRSIGLPMSPAVRVTQKYTSKLKCFTQHVLSQSHRLAAAAAAAAAADSAVYVARQRCSADAPV